MINTDKIIFNPNDQRHQRSEFISNTIHFHSKFFPIKSTCFFDKMARGEWDV